MQKQPDLAKNLENLFRDTAYVEFGEGDFINQPNMTGYFYIFKNITNPRFCVILNTSPNVKYPAPMTKIQDYVFIVFNIESLEEYLENLGIKYFPQLLQIVDQNLQKKNPRNLPYGYYTDENGDIKIDFKKADEVRRIYNRYIEVESVRQIVDEMRSNFSHVRDILHDNEAYMQMREKILPMTKIKKVNELLAANVKGAFKKMTTADKLKEIRKNRKEKEKAEALKALN